MLGRAALALVLLASPAHAEPGVCHIVDVTLQPEARADLRPARNMPPQIVVWIEDPSGAYVDTAFITQSIGTYGLGNRPGRFDFNSAPRWPYGRRITTFPVWADKKPQRYDAIVFRDKFEDALSHAFDQSSQDLHYCRPMSPDPNVEPRDEPHYDALTCASPNMVYTDKGQRFPDLVSKYPPRQDMLRDPVNDHSSVDTYRDMNTFDAVSQATPAVGQVATIGWPLPFDLDTGDYVLWVEVSTEYDHNATYTAEARPAPNVSFAGYGEPYRGQPSLVYRVPFTVAGDRRVARTASYHGYGDPDGEDGAIRPPDGTITNDLAGSGEGRLSLIADPDGAYRVRVVSRIELDVVVPNAPSRLAVIEEAARSVTLSFVAPGDDAVMGTVRGYEIRFRAGSPVTAENFDAADTVAVPSAIVPLAAGELQELELFGLLPETDYHVGIRAYDDCKNTSAIGTLAFTTPPRTVGEVDACFVATAAYGSPLARDVTMLRDVRDSVLRRTVIGELVVQTYYTFGPPIAGVIGESELLRATARAALAPLVATVRRSR